MCPFAVVDGHDEITMPGSTDKPMADEPASPQDATPISVLGRQETDEAAVRAAMAADALERWGIFGGDDEPQQVRWDNNDNSTHTKDEPAQDPQEKKRMRKRTLFKLFLTVMSVLLVAAGVLLQVIKESPEDKVAFRWCYFIAGIYPAFWASSKLIKYLIHTAE
eukprot:scaffold156729_cov46-Prasinocladus_malaysianus.AAC.1